MGHVRLHSSGSVGHVFFYKEIFGFLSGIVWGVLFLVPYYGFTGKSFDNLFDLVAGVLV